MISIASPADGVLSKCLCGPLPGVGSEPQLVSLVELHVSCLCPLNEPNVHIDCERAEAEALTCP